MYRCIYVYTSLPFHWNAALDTWVEHQSGVPGCAEHTLLTTSPPLSVTYASVHFGGSFKVQSSHLIFNFILEVSPTQQKCPCSHASGCRRVCWQMVEMTLSSRFSSLWSTSWSSGVVGWVSPCVPQSVTGVHHTCTSVRFNSKVFFQKSINMYLYFSDMGPGFCKSFRSSLSDLCTCTNVWHGDTNVCPNKLEQFPRRGRADSTRTHSSQCCSRNKQEMLGLVDFFSAA